MTTAKSRSRARTTASAPVPGPEDFALPPERAFLLQITEGTRPDVGAFAGRLEHLSSARRLRFQSWDAFRAALGELLGGRR